MSDVILVRELTRRFGDFTAVDRASFSVRKGEVFGFLGPNGAGKTTTIKMLTGLLVPSSGSATVAGLAVGTDSIAIRKSIGYMSQKFSLYGDLTVSENIDLFAGLYGVSGALFDERRAWIISMAALAGNERTLTADLPLGWKQRLALGCAVLHQPPVLFLDEPTSGVDPIARRAFWELIYELSRAGTTVLVSTHYMEEAEYCNRVLLMNRGRIIAEGRPAELRERHRTPILEVQVAHPAEAVAALRGAPNVEEAAMFGRAVHVAVTEESGAAEAIERVLREHDIAVQHVTPVAASLEDVFVALVRSQGGAVAG